MDSPPNPLPSYPSHPASSAFLPLTPSHSLEVSYPSPISSTTTSSPTSSSSSPSFHPQPSPLNLPDSFYSLPSVPLAPVIFPQEDPISSLPQEKSRRHSTVPNPPSSSSQPSSRVPRPLNSFMTYRKVKQHEVIRLNPSVDNRDISRIVAKWWGSEPASVKEHYKRLADQGKREHLLKYPGYKYAPRKKGLKKTSGSISALPRKGKVISSPRSGYDHIHSHHHGHPHHHAHQTAQHEYSPIEHQVIPYSLPFLTPSPTVQDESQILPFTPPPQLDLTCSAASSPSPSSYDFLLPSYLTSMLDSDKDLVMATASGTAPQDLFANVSPALTSQDFFPHASPTISSIAAVPGPLDNHVGDSWLLQAHESAFGSEIPLPTETDRMVSANMLGSMAPHTSSPWSVLPPMAPTLLVDPSVTFDSA